MNSDVLEEYKTRHLLLQIIIRNRGVETIKNEEIVCICLSLPCCHTIGEFYKDLLKLFLALEIFLICSFRFLKRLQLESLISFQKVQNQLAQK